MRSAMLFLNSMILEALNSEFLVEKVKLYLDSTKAKHGQDVDFAFWSH